VELGEDGGRLCVGEILLPHPFLTSFPGVVVASPLDLQGVQSQTTRRGVFSFLEDVVGTKVFGVAEEPIQTICEGIKGKFRDVPFRVINHTNLGLNEGKEIMVRTATRKGEETENDILAGERCLL
jgi:hypothetical protein